MVSPVRNPARARRPTRGRLARSVTTTSFVAGVLALAVAQLLALPSASADTGDPIPHPERDYMGSTTPDYTSQASSRARTWPEVRDVVPGAQVPGIDVSHWQGEIDWGAVADSGIRFAYMKATEGTSYTDPQFAENYTSSYNQGLIRGAYHFALPGNSGGAAQARFFVDNGGGWSADGQTLPPALDIEYNPYGENCYGLDHGEMVDWIANFSTTVKRLTGRFPAIYTTRDWWRQCTGNHGEFGDTSPLWIANWGRDPYPLPSGWPVYTVWQYTSTGSVPGISGDVGRDVFNGSPERLRALAACTNENPC